MTGINDIRRLAIALGACDKVESIKSVSDAVDLLMTPQGREFALKTGFPTLEVWRANVEKVNATPRVFLDTLNVNVGNHNCVAIGNTKLHVNLNGVDQLYHVIAMHGAEVEINASNYAVVTVTSIKATVRITNDGTAKVTVEQSEKGGKS
ncbi:MAG: hypothetical protein HDS35_00065 [Bacteroides sp.]|nr:hypothetical protein [Bacteroides sp.]